MREKCNAVHTRLLDLDISIETKVQVNSGAPPFVLHTARGLGGDASISFVGIINLNSNVWAQTSAATSGHGLVIQGSIRRTSIKRKMMLMMPRQVYIIYAVL